MKYIISKLGYDPFEDVGLDEFDILIGVKIGVKIKQMPMQFRLFWR